MRTSSGLSQSSLHKYGVTRCGENSYWVVNELSGHGAKLRICMFLYVFLHLRGIPQISVFYDMFIKCLKHNIATRVLTFAGE